MIKADAYGHGAVAVGRELEAAGVDWLGVALVEEGAELRRGGVEAPILVLGPAQDDPAPALRAPPAHARRVEPGAARRLARLHGRGRAAPADPSQGRHRHDPPGDRRRRVRRGARPGAAQLGAGARRSALAPRRRRPRREPAQRRADRALRGAGRAAAAGGAGLRRGPPRQHRGGPPSPRRPALAGAARAGALRHRSRGARSGTCGRCCRSRRAWCRCARSGRESRWATAGSAPRPVPAASRSFRSATPTATAGGCRTGRRCCSAGAARRWPAR